MFSSAVFWAQRSSLTARIVKYDANSAAKNISSLESQMIVPTLTMLGRSWCPCRREAGIAVAVATGAHYVGSPAPRAPRPPDFGGHIVHSVLGMRRPTAVPDPPRVHPRDGCSRRLVAGAGPVRPDRLGRRALPPRRGRAAPPRGPLAGRPDGRRSWWSGWAVLLVATSSGLAAYDTTLLSVHMVQHMVLSMLVPLALALGAPVTLALRTLPAAAAALAAGRACTRGWRGAVVPAADVRAVRRLAVGALLLRLVRRVAAARRTSTR